jgi:dTDP-4-dehydrorhamnose 3,5-epimerase
MKFVPTAIPEVVIVEAPPIGDERGYFQRTFCAREMADAGLNHHLAQASVSFNAARGTLRGLHFQAYPALEDKLVRCIRGAIFDVMVDIRPGSRSFGEWTACELSESNWRQLYAPKGFAHGFQTLTEDALVAYQISQFYEPAKSAGVRFDDPDIAVRWPLEPVGLSGRDKALPFLRDIDPAAVGAVPGRAL